MPREGAVRDAKVCALPLCTNHARKASDEYRCDACAMTQNSTMPKPPERSKRERLSRLSTMRKLKDEKHTLEQTRTICKKSSVLSNAKRRSVHPGVGWRWVVHVPFVDCPWPCDGAQKPPIPVQCADSAGVISSDDSMRHCSPAQTHCHPIASCGQGSRAVRMRDKRYGNGCPRTTLRTTRP